MATKVFYDFDPEEETGIKVPKAKRGEALEAVADFVKESVLSTVGSGATPVEGGKWKKSLSKAYKKRKGDVSSSNFANLELHGDMLDSLDVVKKRGPKPLRLLVDDDQMDKADGHNNFSGKSKLPERNFIPDASRGQRLSPKIRRGMKSILEEYSEDED